MDLTYDHEHLGTSIDALQAIADGSSPFAATPQAELTDTVQLHAPYPSLHGSPPHSIVFQASFLGFGKLRKRIFDAQLRVPGQ